MIRGTTPLLEFIFQFDTTELAEAFVTLSQNGEVVLDIPMKDCAVEGNKLSVRLTQEETLKLQGCQTTFIQVRARTVMGEALASQIFAEPTYQILKDGVI